LGSLTGKRERRETQQVPLPPPRRFSRNIPDTLGRNDEGSGDINVRVDEDRRNRSRVLKVRLLFCLLSRFCSWLTGRDVRDMTL
jgi:hypothetical protein